jgi:hypothetical protein
MVRNIQSSSITKSGGKRDLLTGTGLLLLVGNVTVKSMMVNALELTVVLLWSPDMEMETSVGEPVSI